MPISTTKEINEALRKQMISASSVKISGLDGQDNIAVGIDKDAKVLVDGKAGDFFGALNSHAEITVKGDTDSFAGYMMSGGKIFIDGDSGNMLGHKMKNGMIVVSGDVESVGNVLGGDIFVKGEIKDMGNVEIQTLNDNEKEMLQKHNLDEAKKIVSKKIEYRKTDFRPVVSSLDNLILLKKENETIGEVDTGLEIGQLRLKTPIFLSPDKPNPGFALGASESGTFSVCQSKEEIENVKNNIVVRWQSFTDLEVCNAVELNPVDFKEIELLREVTEHKKTIILRIPPFDLYENMKKALKAKPDAIAVDCSYFPAVGVFGSALKAFEEANAKEKNIKLLILANLRSAEDAVKALALGADGIGFFYNERNGDVEAVSSEVSNFINMMNEEIKNITASVGHSSINGLSRNDLMALTYDAAAITGVKLIGYDRVL
ncbi:MAG: hypothetical protein L6265_09395, partial [Thermoplasmatales archaeon]|nr:hypothetical protein [Thermoplasmatales archaeon]